MISLRLCRLVVCLIGLFLILISGGIALRGKYGEDVRFMAFQKPIDDFHTNISLRIVDDPKDRWEWNVSNSSESVAFLGWLNNKILYRQIREPYPTFLVDWNQQNRQQLHTGDALYDMSPDGQWLVFQTPETWNGTSDIYRFLRLTDRHMIDLEMAYQYYWLSENSILYVHDNNVYRAILGNDVQSELLFRAENPIGSGRQLSANKRWLVFTTTDDEVTIINSLDLNDNSHHELMRSGRRLTIRGYSPNGQWLIAAEYHEEFTTSNYYRIAADGHTPPLQFFSGNNVNALEITNDRIVWSDAEGLFSLPMTTNTPLQLSNGPVGRFNLYRDGVIYLSGTRTVPTMIYHHVDGQQQQIVIPNNGQPIYEYWLTDNGEWMVFHFQDQTLMRMRIDDGDSAQIILPPDYIYSFAMFPDGQHFGYLQGTWYEYFFTTVNLNDGTQEMIPINVPLLINILDQPYPFTEYNLSITTVEGLDQLNVEITSDSFENNIYDLRIDLQSEHGYFLPIHYLRGGTIGYIKPFTPFATLNIAANLHPTPFLGGLFLNILALLTRKRLRRKNSGRPLAHF